MSKMPIDMLRDSMKPLSAEALDHITKADNKDMKYAAQCEIERRRLNHILPYKLEILKKRKK